LVELTDLKKGFVKRHLLVQLIALYNWRKDSGDWQALDFFISSCVALFDIQGILHPLLFMKAASA